MNQTDRFKTANIAFVGFFLLLVIFVAMLFGNITTQEKELRKLQKTVHDSTG